MTWHKAAPCLIALLVLGIASPLHAYDREQALNYVSKWWNSTTLEGEQGQGLSPTGIVDHINNPPYSWYYTKSFVIFGVHSSDNGTGGITIPHTNTFPFIFEEDCTNWVSQVLSSGGVQLAGAVDGNGGTEISVAKLRTGMIASGVPEEDWYQGQLPPSDLVPGDIVQFDNMHTTVIVATGVAGGGIALAAHSHDRNFWPIVNYFGSSRNTVKSLQAWHQSA